ncbi:MAG: DMT family transporter [Acidimicrobiales bacterium]
MDRRYLALGAVTAGWGTIPVLAGWSQLPAAIIVAMRLWSGAACLGLVLLVQRRRAHHLRLAPTGGEPTSGSPPRLLSIAPVRCCLTAAVLGLHWLALFAAYERAPAGTVILIVYLAPLGVAALAPRVLGERLNRWTIVTLVGALAGLILLSAPAAHSAGASGLALSLVAAVLFVALILLSKSLAPVYGGLRLAFMELAGAGILIIPVGLAIQWPRFGSSWYWVIVLGVVHTALGITLYLSLLARIPATHVGIMSYLEPVVVILAAWLWLGQRPTLATALGGGLVVAAGVVLAVTSLAPGGHELGQEAVLLPVDPAVPTR